MTDRREQIAALVAVSVLAVVTAFMLFCAAMLLVGALIGDAVPGSTYLALVRSADDIRSVFSIAILVITAGVNILARRQTTGRMIYISSALCVLALGACFVLLVQLGQNPEAANRLWSNSDPQMSPAELQIGNKAFLTGVAAWVSVFLATQLGIAVAGAQRKDGSKAEATPEPADQKPEVGAMK